MDKSSTVSEYVVKSSKPGSNSLNPVPVKTFLLKICKLEFAWKVYVNLFKYIYTSFVYLEK